MATTSVTPPSEQARRAPDPKSGPRGSLSQTLQSRGWGPRLGYVLLLLVLGYLIVLPLIQLQSLAFEDGAAGYKSQYGSPKQCAHRMNAGWSCIALPPRWRPREQRAPSGTTI